MTTGFIKAATIAVLVAGIGSALPAQVSPLPGTSYTELQRHDLSAPGREMVQARVGISPGVEAPRHKHPGEEIIYVLEGTLEYRVEGRAPVTLKAGQVLFVPAETIHSARNVGTEYASELATYIVEKGKPLLVPVR